MEETLNWGKIKNGFSGFEELAFCYVKECYKNDTWEKTPATRDGNKDAVAVVVGYMKDSIGEQKWWMEAKYSDETKPLSRYRLDATIVSAILEKNVSKIIFVTNIILKPKTISDLQKALVLATGYDDIKFVGKYDLEYWLFQNHGYMEKFFEPQEHKFKLSEFFLINNAEYYNCDREVLSFKESLQFLQKNIPYHMHFSLFSSVPKKSKVVSNPALRGIKFLSDKNIQLHSGENRITVDFILKENFSGKGKKTYNSEPLFFIESYPIISEKIITVSENKKEYLALEYQENVLKILKQKLREFNNKNLFKLHAIIGNSGSGKSTIVYKFLQLKECRKNEVFHCEFSDSSSDNIIALVNLVIYIHFPYLSADDIDSDYLKNLNCEHYTSVYFKKLVENRFNFEALNKTLADIHTADDIFPVNLNINSRIVMLDNIHKLKDIEKNFLLNIIHGLYLRKSPVFFILIEQRQLNGMFSNKLCSYMPLSSSDCQLEKKDIIKHLRNIPAFHSFCDELVDYQVLFPNIIDFIMFFKYCSDIKEEINNIDDFYVAYSSFINSDISSQYMLDQFNKLFSEDKSARKYCDIIFWSEYGYSSDEINLNEARTIKQLLNYGLIQCNSNGNIIPCHDIYKKFYQEHFKPLESEFLKSNHGITDITTMISSNLFSVLQWNDYRDELRELINNQKFYTVNYSLDGLFQMQDCLSFKRIIGIELYYEFYIIYAVSSTNISRTISGKKLFGKIADETANSTTVRLLRVHEEAVWELINSFYDSLLFDEANKSIKELIMTLNKLKTFGIINENIVTNVRYHDIMVIKSLIEADTNAPNHYKYFKQRNELMIKNNFIYRAITYSVRYAQTIMRRTPKNALQLLENAMKEIENMRGGSDKYYLWAAFGYYYLLITFKNDFKSLSQLKDIHEQMKTNYYNDYRKKSIGMAALFLQLEDISQGFEYIFSNACAQREMRPRQKAFYYESLALSEALQNQYENAIDHLKKSIKIFENLPEYKDIALHNINILSTGIFSQNNICYCYDKTLHTNIYYIDPRCIW